MSNVVLTSNGYHGVRNRDLRTRGGHKKKERAENYVECVRSVAGGVYFVMQINARLPKHPSPALARPPATPYPRSYPCFPSRRCVYVCVSVCGIAGTCFEVYTCNKYDPPPPP